MNDDFRELKLRIRRLDALLAAQGAGNVPLAQALSAVRRAERHGNRTRAPSPALRALLDKAETVGRTLPERP